MMILTNLELIAVFDIYQLVSNAHGFKSSNK